MRRIICLTAEDPTSGDSTYRTYLVGAGIGGGASVEKIVNLIEFAEYAADEEIMAVDFSDGTRRIIPWYQVISYDLEPEEKRCE